MKLSLKDEFYIEYSAVMPISACEITLGRLLDRENIGQDGSVLLFLMPYFRKTAMGGNLSVYAALRDYHAVFSDISKKITERLAELCPTARFVGFADHAPINEKTAAASAGLGVIGQNSLLINEKYSSFVFIGGIYSDIGADEWKNIISDGTKFPTEFKISHCDGCGMCRQACPACAITEDGKVNAETCLSAVSQKKKLTADEEKVLADAPYLWGCDVCQLVCPVTKKAMAEGTIETPIENFCENIMPNLDDGILDSLLASGEFSRRAYSWRGEAVLRRNIRLQKEKEINIK